MTQQIDQMLFGLEGHKTVPQKGWLHYTGCGLDNVWLCSGFTREVIDGDEYISVTNLEGLYASIALRIATLRRPLIGAEVAFLRKFIDKTQEDLGNMLGVTRKTINTWEREGGIGRSEQYKLQVSLLLGMLNENAKKRVLQDLLQWLRDRTTETSTCDDADELPPAFIADAALGGWQVSQFQS